MKIAVGSDHAAYDMRQLIKAHLIQKGHAVLDLGCPTPERADYPVYGAAVGKAVVAGEADLGIAICGTGVGISMAANKVKGVRAACVSESFSARMCREHNDANVLCFGARVVGEEVAKQIVNAFLEGQFQGGRHAARVDLIAELESSWGQ